MSGRELIVYILENHLEDEEVFKDGKFVGFLTLEEAAIKLGSGTATVQVLLGMNEIDGIIMAKDTILIADDTNLDRFTIE